MTGHFLFLERLLRGVRHLQFSLDQEPLIRTACLLSFAPRVRVGTVLAYLVNIDKTLTVEERKVELARAAQAFEALREDTSPDDDFALVVRVIRERHLAAMGREGGARGRWIAHPLPTMNEPRKSVQCLTALPNIDLERLARGYARASLNPVDRFFMQVRRRLSTMERPIASASNQRRMWHGYSAPTTPRSPRKSWAFFVCSTTTT
jgi:hypothetical protein